MKAKKFINGKIHAILSKIGDTVSSIKENGLSIETHKYWQIIDGVRYNGEIRVTIDTKTWVKSVEYIFNGNVCFTEFEYAKTALASN